jgi:hypothetical protein
MTANMSRGRPGVQRRAWQSFTRTVCRMDILPVTKVTKVAKAVSVVQGFL